MKGVYWNNGCEGCVSLEEAGYSDIALPARNDWAFTCMICGQRYAVGDVVIQEFSGDLKSTWHERCAAMEQSNG